MLLLRFVNLVRPKRSCDCEPVTKLKQVEAIDRLIFKVTKFCIVWFGHHVNNLCGKRAILVHLMAYRPEL